MDTRPVPAATVPPTELPPLPEALVVVKGGRLLDSGKAVVVGELDKTSFGDFQLNLDDSKGASRSIFVSIFSASESGMTKSLRYGISGDNTVAGTAPAISPKNLLMAGFTSSGLRNNLTNSQSPSNYLAEIDDEGEIVRYYTWPVPPSSENVRALTSNSTTSFAAVEVHTGVNEVFVKAFRPSQAGHTFTEFTAAPVCQVASQGAVSVRVASVDSTETEVVAAVEIATSSSPGIVFPCFEVFRIQPNGSLVSSGPSREIVNLSSTPAVPLTVKARFVGENRIILARSRPNTDSTGQGVAVVTSLFDRPTDAGKFDSTLWGQSRPEWYSDESIDGLHRNIMDVVWPRGSSQTDIVWILSSDETQRDGVKESLVHLGSYSVTHAKE